MQRLRSRFSQWLNPKSSASAPLAAASSSSVNLLAPDYKDLYCSMHSRAGLMRDCHGVVFSFDRAFQLHGLLNSYRHFVTSQCPLTVLYRASTDEHEAAYRQIQSEVGGQKFRFVRQASADSFKEDLERILLELKTYALFFLVDDNVFKNATDLGFWLGFDLRDSVPTMRMAPGMTRCYTANEFQGEPQFLRGGASESFQRWIWGEGRFDWAYPLSVDGHFFLRDEITALIRGSTFRSPNTLEGSLQKYQAYFEKRTGVCERKAAIVNLAVNRVQTDNTNRHGSVHQDELLALWREGLRFDFKALSGMVTESAHVEITEIPRYRATGAREGELRPS